MAGSYGGVAFMILDVLFVLVMIGLLGWPSTTYLFRRFRGIPFDTADQILMRVCFLAVGVLSVSTWLLAMRPGVRALQEMRHR
jgi:hypothetical protein